MENHDDGQRLLWRREQRRASTLDSMLRILWFFVDLLIERVDGVHLIVKSFLFSSNRGGDFFEKFY